MNKTVIVVGATGLIGKELVRFLADEPSIARVVTLTRRPITYAGSKVTNHVVDFDNLQDSAKLFKGDVLFSCLGTTAKQAGSIRAQRIVDLDYQLDAARLAAEQGVSHYVLVSSSGANAKSFSPYLKMKGQLEDDVIKLGFEHTSIIQPSLLLGERADARMGEQLASKIMPALCKLSGLGRYQPISGRDVALRMIEVVNSPQPGVERLSLDEVFPLASKTSSA